MPGANHKFGGGVCLSCNCKIDSDEANQPCKNHGHILYSYENKCSVCNCLKTSMWYKEPCPGKFTCKDYVKKYNNSGGRRTRRSRTRRSRTRRSRRSRMR